MAKKVKSKTGEHRPQTQIFTDPLYWDCECEIEYVHSKDVNFCRTCGTLSEDQPDSRASEIKYLYNPQNDLKCGKRKPVQCGWCPDQFLPDPGSGKTRFCSDSCEQEYRKRN